MLKILFGTQNKGKQVEIEEVLAGLPIELVFPAQLPSVAELDPIEDGSTFSENALLKAKQFAEASGLISIADDSGLEIEALDKFPGVHSKRFLAGSDHDRNQEVLKRLQDSTDRRARFVTVLAYYEPQTQVATFFEGEVKGQIARAEKGSDGFGYDPIFIPEGFETTFAQMGVAQKNTLSHRKNALDKLKIFLNQQVKTA